MCDSPTLWPRPLKTPRASPFRALATVSLKIVPYMQKVTLSLHLEHLGGRLLDLSVYLGRPHREKLSCKKK